MVFYFTATGNSLYIAKQFDKNPISIPQIIDGDQLTFEDSEIGIVCPIFAGEPPKIVWEFLRKATFKTDYLYVIYTYGKSDSDAPEYLDKIATEAGININYIHSIQMVDNYLPSFDMNEEMAIDKKIDQQLAVALIDVRNKKEEIPVAPQSGRELHGMVAKYHAENPGLINGAQITVTDKCNGCGICAKVCPIGIFYMDDFKAARTQNTCEFCLACAQSCPQKAITLSASDKNPDARYRNVNVSLAEIIEANNQQK